MPVRQRPLAGRAEELATLQQALEGAVAGDGGLVMLAGEPGIGKTRLVEELETSAKASSAQAVWGRCYEDAGAPAYWPWIQIGRQWGAANDIRLLEPLLGGEGGELVRLFPELEQARGFAEPEPLAEPEGARFRLFQAYTDFIRIVSEQQPMVIVLDDVHWADHSSLLLLQHLGRDVDQMRVLVVCTYRDTELARTHRLSETLAELNRSPGFERILLRGLSKKDVAAYVRETANVTPMPAVSERIYEATEGNPFFLGEVVDLLEREGTLEQDSLSRIAVPEGVKEALGRRLDRLSEDTIGLLNMAAVIGREFTHNTLTLVAERSDEELLRVIEEGLAAWVIEETDHSGRYRFTHALMRETLLGEVSATRRARLHGYVADALERRDGISGRTREAQLAWHFSESATLTPEHVEKALHYSQLAAGRAESVYAWEDAARHYERCLRFLEEGEELELAGILHAHGQAAFAGADWRSAWRGFMQALDIYRAHDDHLSFARVALDALAVRAPVGRLQAFRDEALQFTSYLTPSWKRACS